MECNGIPYEIIESGWNVKVLAKDFANYLNKLIKSLKKNEVINLTIFSNEEPIKEQAGTVYKDLKELKLIYDDDNKITDILITFKDGIISLKSIFKEVPRRFFFFNLYDLKYFSSWDSLFTEYEAVYLMLFFLNSVRRIRFTKEVLSDE